MKLQVETAVVQMSTTWLGADDNRAKMVKYVRDTAEEGPVDLIVFPELPRILSLQGAEILIGIYNWGWPAGQYGPGRLSRLAAVRALENKNFFIACSKVGVEDEHVFYGNSTIAGPDGEIMVEATPEHDDEEHVLRASLKHEQVVRERALNTTYRNRRPEMYGLLTEQF